MQNFSLLEAAGRLRKPVMIKRGMSATIQELFMAAEYLLAAGNYQVMLCERGIRTFETMTRNTFDLSAVPMIKHHTHLPVVADPSHGVGIDWAVPPLANAAVVAGADAVMLEIHPDPRLARSDGQQSLRLSRSCSDWHARARGDGERGRAAAATGVQLVKELSRCLVIRGGEAVDCPVETRGSILTDEETRTPKIATRRTTGKRTARRITTLKGRKAGMTRATGTPTMSPPARRFGS